MGKDRAAIDGDYIELHIIIKILHFTAFSFMEHLRDRRGKICIRSQRPAKTKRIIPERYLAIISASYPCGQFIVTLFVAPFSSTTISIIEAPAKLNHMQEKTPRVALRTNYGISHGMANKGDSDPSILSPENTASERGANNKQIY